MNIHRYLAALLIAPALTLTQPSLAQSSKPNLNQELTMYAKPAVVRIVNGCYGSYEWNSKGEWKRQSFLLLRRFFGTGFLINPSGYIVTTANVMEKGECRDRLSRNIMQKIEEDHQEKKSKEDINKKLEDNDDYYVGSVYLPNADAKPFSFVVKYSGREEGEQKVENLSENIAIIKISVTNAPTLTLGDSSQVEIQERILTVGYPTAADIDIDQELAEESFYEASVTEGRVSNPNKKLSSGNPVLQIDVRAAEGSGGSPLLNDQGKVIGMLASNKSAEDKDKQDDTNAIPLAIPTSTIWEFIRQSGATNERGATDEYYRNGLDLYWKGNYQEARAKFLKVKGLFKNHSEVERLISEIDQIEADRWSKPWKNPTYRLMLALVAGGGVVAAVAYFLLRHQSSARKASTVSAGVSAEGRSVSTNSYERNGFGGSQSWLELESKGQIRRFQLYKDEHRLGRDPAWSDFDIPTSWEVISRHHAILRKEGEDYRIYDGDGTVPSRNGLWIDDDLRVDPQDGYPLKNGDRLKIGKDPHEQVILTYSNYTINQAGVKETKTAD